MATIDQLSRWEHDLAEMDALYREVEQTTAAQGEMIADLSGSTGSGGPPPMPGGDRVASVAVFNEHAPADPEAFPHPLLFLYTWSWHCAEAAGGLPPRRAWKPALDYLQGHMHWIEGVHADDFQEHLSRVRGSLRRLCNTDRPSQAEEIWMGIGRRNQARSIIRGLVERGELPEWLPPANGRRYRTPFMVTRDEGCAAYPEMKLPDEDLFYGVDIDEVDRINAAWHRIAARTSYWVTEHKERRERGTYKLEYVAEEAAKITAR